ncbi:MAG: hypothetical protein HY686_07800 [Chloroflexi bacterium]|nr:hypothetical protein [Chloroflexota bacterium]
MKARRSGVIRWTLCIPRYCLYAHACPAKALRQRAMERSKCLRFAPEERRPEPGLSPFALAVLERLNRQKPHRRMQSQGEVVA